MQSRIAIIQVYSGPVAVVNEHPKRESCNLTTAHLIRRHNLVDLFATPSTSSVAFYFLNYVKNLHILLIALVQPPSVSHHPAVWLWKPASPHDSFCGIDLFDPFFASSLSFPSPFQAQSSRRNREIVLHATWRRTVPAGMDRSVIAFREVEICSAGC